MGVKGRAFFSYIPSKAYSSKLLNGFHIVANISSLRMTDASNWLPLTPLERRDVALRCLAEVYDDLMDDVGKIINVRKLYIESADHVWSRSTATGDAMFLPGQFQNHFDKAREPEGLIYFAGEHLSYHHTWISGAATSALKVVRDMLGKKTFPPLSLPTHRGKKRQHYKKQLRVKAPFHFRQNSLMFVGTPHISNLWPPAEYDETTDEGQGDPGRKDNLNKEKENDDNEDASDKEEEGDDTEDDSDEEEESDDPEDAGDKLTGDDAEDNIPNSLGMLDRNALGVVHSHLKSSWAVASWGGGLLKLK